MSAARWRVVVADDHAVTRRGVAVMLGTIAGVEVMGEAASGEEAVRLAAATNANLVMMDISMPGIGGVEAARQVKESVPEAAVIMLTVNDDEGTIHDAVDAGASGYLSKASGADDIAAAITALDSGGVYMSPSVTRTLIRSVADEMQNGSPSVNGIAAPTPREGEILALLGEGMTARAISRRLGISERTVNTHVGNLYRRLGATNRVEAIRIAMRAGFIDTPHRAPAQATRPSSVRR